MLHVNVKKHLGDRIKDNFLLDVSFSVGSGITVLAGASGSGKTTTLRLIAGILAPTSGVIKVNSEIYFDSNRRVNLSIQKRRVGFVFQNYALFPHLTAERNVAYGIKAGNKSARFDKAREMLALCRIEHLRKRLPREMSGGEQQRAALARTLASDPVIVLLDEPLSAVDVKTRARLLDEIENVHVRTNVPFLYVTHNQAETARLGKQRIELQNGRVVKEG